MAGADGRGSWIETPDALGPRYAGEFLPKYEKKYGQKPTGAFHPHGYDAAMIVFASVEILFEVFESVTPAGVLMLAELVRVPVAVGLMVPLTT